MCNVKWIDNDLTISHKCTPLLEQEQMRALEAKEMESSSKINLKDVSWWMSIKDVYRPGALVTTKLSKEKCTFLTTRGRLSQIAWRQNWRRSRPPSI